MDEPKLDLTDFSLNAQLAFIKQEAELIDDHLQHLPEGFEKELWKYRAQMFKEVSGTIGLLNAIS